MLQNPFSNYFRLLFGILLRILLSLAILCMGSLVDSSEVLAETVTPPQTCRLGVYVASLQNLNLAEKNFSTDLNIWSVCPSKELQPLKTMKVLNVEDFKRFQAVYEDTLERKDLPKWFYPQENVYLSGLKVRATLYHSWNVSNFPFDRHTLTIALEETTKNSSQFVYTTDFKDSGYQSNIDLDGWEITKFNIVEQKAPYATSFGDPDLVASKTSYSRMVVSIDIKRAKMFSFFKLMIGAYIAFAVAMLSFFYDSNNVTLASPRRALDIGTLFATLLSMRLQESVLGRTEDITLVDQIHIATILYIFGTGVVSVYSRLTTESGKPQLALWRDRTFFFRLFTFSFIAFNVIAISYAIIVG